MENRHQTFLHFFSPGVFLLCDLLLLRPWHWDHWLRSEDSMSFMSNNNKEQTYLLADFQVIIAIINKRLVVRIHIYTGEPELQHWHGHAGVWSLLSGRESLQDCDSGIGGDWAGEAGRGLTASQHQLLSAEVSCYHHDHDPQTWASRENSSQWHVQNVYLNVFKGRVGCVKKC